MHKIIANIASIAHVASGVLYNFIAIAIAHIARSERAFIYYDTTDTIIHLTVGNSKQHVPL